MSILNSIFKLASPKKGIQKDIIPKDLDYASGTIFVEENPDKLLEDLSLDIEIYDKMLMDDRIRFSHNLKKRLILSVPYRIAAASDEDKDLEIKDEVEKQLHINRESKYPTAIGFNFINALDNALDAMVYGNKVAEVSYRVDGDKTYIYNIKHRHAKFFDYKYDKYGDLEELVIGKDYGEDIRISGDDLKNKFLIFSYPYPKDGNFYGESDLQAVYKLFRSKDHIFKQRNRHLEKWGTPIPDIVYDSMKTSAGEKNDMEDMLKHFHDSLYIMRPGYRNKDGELLGKFELNIHEAKSGSNTSHFESAIDQIDKQITRTMLLADKLGFSESPGGSYNLGEIQFNMLQAIIKYMHSFIEERVNPLVKNIVDMNFDGVERYPRFYFDEIDDNVSSDLLKMLIDSGVVDKREKWIRSNIGIPELSEEEKEAIEIEKEKDMPMMPSPGTMPNKEEDDDNNQENFKSSKNPFNSSGAKKYLDAKEIEFENGYTEIHKSISDGLVKQIEKKKIIEEKKINEPLFIYKKELNKYLRDQFVTIYFNGRADAIEEVDSRAKANGLINEDGSFKFQVEPEINDNEWLDDAFVLSFFGKYGPLGKISKEENIYLKYIKDQAFYITGIEEERIIKAVKAEIVSGIDAGLPTKSIISKIQDVLTADRQKYAKTIVRTNTASYYNNGRMQFFNSKDVSKMIEAYQYQAILDNTTTDFCASHDGQIIKADDPQLGTMTPPNHFNCRSVFVPILRGDSDEPGYFKDYKTKYKSWGTSIPEKAIKPAKGFGG